MNCVTDHTYHAPSYRAPIKILLVTFVSMLTVLSISEIGNLNEYCVISSDIVMILILILVQIYCISFFLPECAANDAIVLNVHQENKDDFFWY